MAADHRDLLTFTNPQEPPRDVTRGSRKQGAARQQAPQHYSSAGGGDDADGDEDAGEVAVSGGEEEEEGGDSGSSVKCSRSLTTSTSTSLPSKNVPAKISLAICTGFRV